MIGICIWLITSGSMSMSVFCVLALLATPCLCMTLPHFYAPRPHPAFSPHTADAPCLRIIPTPPGSKLCPVDPAQLCARSQELRVIPEIRNFTYQNRNIPMHFLQRTICSPIHSEGRSWAKLQHLQSAVREGNTGEGWNESYPTSHALSDVGPFPRFEQVDCELFHTACLRFLGCPAIRNDFCPSQ